MLARNVPIGQPDGVSFLPTNRNLVLGERDDSSISLIVFDDQFKHSTSVAYTCLLS